MGDHRMVAGESEKEGHMVIESSHKVVAGSSLSLGVDTEGTWTDFQLRREVVVVQAGSTPASQGGSSFRLAVDSDKAAVGR